MAKKREIKNDHHTITPADRAVFREAMRGVKPLAMHTVVRSSNTSSSQIKKRVIRHPAPTHPMQSLMLSDHEYLDSVKGEELIECKKNGISHKVLRKLRAGQYNVGAILDLHGMSVAEAKSALAQFLHQCTTKGTRHALIIHGKGRANHYPILKNKLNHWLREIDHVLAFCSAQPKDGHSGALYVLLKNSIGETLT